MFTLPRLPCFFGVHSGTFSAYGLQTTQTQYRWFLLLRAAHDKKTWQVMLVGEKGRSSFMDHLTFDLKEIRKGYCAQFYKFAWGRRRTPAHAEPCHTHIWWMSHAVCVHNFLICSQALTVTYGAPFARSVCKRAAECQEFIRITSSEACLLNERHCDAEGYRHKESEYVMSVFSSCCVFVFFVVLFQSLQGCFLEKFTRCSKTRNTFSTPGVQFVIFIFDI